MSGCIPTSVKLCAERQRRDMSRRRKRRRSTPFRPSIGWICATSLPGVRLDWMGSPWTWYLTSQATWDMEREPQEKDHEHSHRDHTCYCMVAAIGSDQPENSHRKG